MEHAARDGMMADALPTFPRVSPDYDHIRSFRPSKLNEMGVGAPPVAVEADPYAGPTEHFPHMLPKVALLDTYRP